MSHWQKKRHGGYYNQKFIKKKREYVLEPGLKGFICTCNSREKDCIKESYNILNEYADQLYGNEGNESTSSNPTTEDTKVEAEEEDIEVALSRELGNLKQERRKSHRFQVVKSGAANCLFITTTLPDPTELAYSIMNDIYTSKQQKSRFLLRLIPIEVTCKAYMDDIQKSAAGLFDKYFSKEGKTFAIAFNHRNNSSLSRSTVIEELADMIKFRHVDNKVDLTKPQLTVIVEVIRAMCCISVVPDYFKLLKYNLLELCGKGEKAAQDAKCAGDTGSVNMNTEENTDEIPPESKDMEGDKNEETGEQRSEDNINSEVSESNENPTLKSTDDTCDKVNIEKDTEDTVNIKTEDAVNIEKDTEDTVNIKTEDAVNIEKEDAVNIKKEDTVNIKKDDFSDIPEKPDDTKVDG